MSDEVRRIGRELIHKGTILEYYVDTMELPDGKQAKWDFIKHNGAAAVVPVMADGRILMVSQYRNALERYTLEIPAGGLNPGESVDTSLAAARELEEETGYASEDLELLLQLYKERGNLLYPACIVDVNHSNSNKKYMEQIRISKEVLHSRRHAKEIHQFVKGLMIESYIEGGNQPVDGHCYGKSITDPCLGWDDTEKLLFTIAEEV